MGKLRPILRWISAPFGAIVVFGCLGLVAMVVAMSSPGLPSPANLQTRHLAGTPAASPSALPSEIPASQIPEMPASDGGPQPTEAPPPPPPAPTPRAAQKHDDHHHGEHPGD